MNLVVQCLKRTLKKIVYIKMQLKTTLKGKSQNAPSSSRLEYIQVMASSV